MIRGQHAAKDMQQSETKTFYYCL